MIETSEKRVTGPVIRLRSNDNIVVARVDVGIGAPIEGEGLGCERNQLRGLMDDEQLFFV